MEREKEKVADWEIGKKKEKRKGYLLILFIFDHHLSLHFVAFVTQFM